MNFLPAVRRLKFSLDYSVANLGGLFFSIIGLSQNSTSLEKLERLSWEKIWFEKVAPKESGLLILACALSTLVAFSLASFYFLFLAKVSRLYVLVFYYVSNQKIKHMIKKNHYHIF